MTGDDNILHADLKKLGVWLRWSVPLLLVGIGGILKYTRDMEETMHQLIISDEKLRSAIVLTQESLSDKYARHLQIHQSLEDRLLYTESRPKDSK